jgi:hypothetical protein
VGSKAGLDVSKSGKSADRSVCSQDNILLMLYRLTSSYNFTHSPETLLCIKMFSFSDTITVFTSYTNSHTHTNQKVHISEFICFTFPASREEMRGLTANMHHMHYVLQCNIHTPTAGISMHTNLHELKSPPRSFGSPVTHQELQ